MASLAPQPNRPRESTLPGVGFTYEAYVTKINESRQSLERIDTKLGILSGFLATGIGAVLTQGIGGKVVAAMLMLPIAIAALGLRVAKGRADPDPDVINRYAGDEVSFIQEIALPSLSRSLRCNRADLESKAWYFNRALLSAVIVLALAVAGKILAVA